MKTPVQQIPEQQNQEQTNPKLKKILKKGVRKNEGNKLLTEVNDVKPVEMQQNENVLGDEKFEKIPVSSEIQSEKLHEKPLEVGINFL